jgi:hypothetical protein
VQRGLKDHKLIQKCDATLEKQCCRLKNPPNNSWYRFTNGRFGA